MGMEYRLRIWNLVFTLETESMEVLSRRSVKVKICAAPKRERSVEEDKRNQIFNPRKSLKLKYSRRSDESLTTNYRNERLGSTNTKSSSLPLSPTSISSIPTHNTSSEQPERCKCNNDSLSVVVNSEKEKVLLVKIRDELRMSPLLNSILSEKLYNMK